MIGEYRSGPPDDDDDHAQEIDRKDKGLLPSLALLIYKFNSNHVVVKLQSQNLNSDKILGTRSKKPRSCTCAQAN